MDVYEMYYDKLIEEVKYGGHVNLTNYMMTLEVMDDENRKDWEKRLMSEITELRMIDTDIKALRTHLNEKPDEISVPKWIMDETIREEARQLLTYAQKYQTVDFRDTPLIPTPRIKGPDFDERLREYIDIDAHIEDSQNELKAYANARLPLPAKDLNQKDMDLLSKVNLIAQAVEVDEVPLFGRDVSLSGIFTTD